MNVSRTLMVLIISVALFSSAHAQQQRRLSPLGLMMKDTIESMVESYKAGEPRMPKSYRRNLNGRSESAWFHTAPIEDVAKWMADGIVECSKAGDFTTMMPYLDGLQLASDSIHAVARSQDAVKIFTKSPGLRQLEQLASNTMLGLLRGPATDTAYPPIFKISAIRRLSKHSATVDIEWLGLKGYRHRTLKVARSRRSYGISDVMAPTTHLSARNLVQYRMIANPESIAGLGSLISESRLLQSPDVARVLAFLDAPSEQEFVETFRTQRELMTPAAKDWRIITFYNCILSLNKDASDEAHANYLRMKETVTDPGSAAWAGIRYGINFGDREIANQSVALWQRSHAATQLQWLELARMAAVAGDGRLANQWLGRVQRQTLTQIPSIVVACEIALRIGDHQRLGKHLDELDRVHNVQLLLDPGSDDWEAFEQSTAFERQQQSLARRWADLPSFRRGVPKPNLHRMIRFAAASKDDSVEPPKLIEDIPPAAVSTWIDEFERALKERDQQALSELIAWDVGLQRDMMIATDSHRLTHDSLKRTDLASYDQTLNERLLRYKDMTLIAVQAPLGLMEFVYRATDPELDYLIFRLMPSQDGVVATEISSLNEGESFCRAEADAMLWASLRLKAVRGKLPARYARVYRHLKQRQQASLPASRRRPFDAVVDGKPVWDISDPVIARQAIAESRTVATKLRWLHLYAKVHDQSRHVAWLMVRDPSLVPSLNAIDKSLSVVQDRIGGDPFLDLVLASSLVDIEAFALAETYAEGVDTEKLNLPLAHELNMKVMIASGNFREAAKDYAALKAKGLHLEALDHVSEVPKIEDFLNSSAFQDAGRTNRGEEGKWKNLRNPFQEL